MPQIRMFLFGPPRIERGGQPVEISLRKAVAILVYVVASQHSHTREALAALFWPEADQSTALGNLRRALHRVNKALQVELLLTTRHSVSRNPDVAIWLDIEVFQQQVASCESSLAEADHQCIVRLSEAVELYTDHFLAGFGLPDSPAFDEWQFFQAESLRQAQATALQRLINWHTGQGHLEQSIAYVRRWLALDVLHEPAHCELMQLYALAGQWSAALRQYQECARLLAKELGVEPGETTTALYDAIKTRAVEPLLSPVHPSRQIEPEQPRVTHNLPLPGTFFVGREKELTEIKALLSDPSFRLLTLIGPGGVGKTRVALQAAFASLDSFQHGAFFVPLAGVTTPDQIVPALAESLSFRSYQEGEPKRQLLDYLRPRQLLLVFDNFEQVSEGADLIVDILQVAPQVRVLVTSRERLNLSAEAVYVLGTMPYPTEQEDLTRALEYPAVKLLVESARQARPQLRLLEQDIRDAARICQLVQGMPLALVLAAGWLGMLSFDEVADQIAHSLEFLESQTRDVPARQRSVQAAFDYSWRRLSQEEQRAFMRLSVFRGHFTLQAARRIASTTLLTLRILIDKSFVTIKPDGQYEIHELLRQFAEQHLELAGQAAATRLAHSQYYLQRLQDLEPDLKGRRQLAALDEVAADIENVRAAWLYTLGRADDAAIDSALESLFLFHYMHGRYQEGAELLHLAREQFAPAPGTGPQPLWGRILARLGFLRSHFRSAREEIAADLELALSIAYRNPSILERAFTLFALGSYTAYAVRDTARAQTFFEASLEHFQVLNDSFYLTLVFIWLGYCHGNASSLDNFNHSMQQALAVARRSGNIVYASNAVANLATGAFCAGAYSEAEQYALESPDVAIASGLRMATAHAKAQLGLGHFLRGGVEQAGLLASSGLEMATDVNFSTTMAYAMAILSLRDSTIGDYASGRDRAEQSLRTASNRFVQILGHWASAIAYCGLERFDAAWQQLQTALHHTREASYVAVQTWLLPVMAVALAHHAQPVLAIELLALAYNHPLSPTGWLEMWPAITTLQDTLRIELGGEGYESAWQRGAASDLATKISDCALGLPVKQ